MKIYQKPFKNSHGITEYATIYHKKNGEISCDCLAGMSPKGITEKDRDFNLAGLPRHSEKYCKHAKDFKKELATGLKTWKDVTPKS